MGRKNKKKIPDGGATPFCPHFELCGGCTYQRFDYQGQAVEKLKIVQGLLNEAYSQYYESDDEQPVFPLDKVLGSPRKTGYRNKMEFSFGDAEKDGPLTLGLHQRGSFYNIVPITDCQIVDSDYRAILWMSLQFFREKEIPYVHKRTHKGVLRHLVIRKTGNEIMVCIVTSSAYGDYGDWVSEYVERLTVLDLYGEIKSVIHIINDSLADVVQADEMKLLYGRDYIEEELLGLRFKITPFSFFQTNSTGAEVLYSQVKEFIGDVSGKTVYDLYSGTGTIAQILAPACKKVIGVEIVKEAVEAARENAKLNRLDNCEFIAGDVLDVLDGISDMPDVMVLDPPREGIHPKVLPKLMSYGVRHFVYVSCKPESLARDLPVILDAGYKPVRSVCVDMFPWTKHVETVVLFTKEDFD